ncbi:MAG TPA: hypothetical protein VGR72_03875 [Candidatus Acidoferrales bacterium]|nr:hypothetical protein [Candidatus Acidoferrales bacterium]
MSQNTEIETLVGRKEELRELRAAIQKREGRLIWGPMDAGKTTLIKKAISELSDAERRKCVYWTGPASGRQLLSHFVGQLYELGDSFIRKKVHADGATGTSLKRWLHKQTSLRLRGILFTASAQGDYRFFVDHVPPPTHNMARLMKEMMYRCKTPIYLAARDYSQGEIGYAWSLYWNNGLRVHLGPLSERGARELLEKCICRFGLASLDLEDFREDILRLSGHVPGSIVKMCELAADSRYHYGDQIKIKLVHVDYLMHSSQSAMAHSPNFLQ